MHLWCPSHYIVKFFVFRTTSVSLPFPLGPMGSHGLAHFGVIRAQFGPCWGHFGANGGSILGSQRDPFWAHDGPKLEPPIGP
jgi:hypothetical protein